MHPMTLGLKKASWTEDKKQDVISDDLLHAFDQSSFLISGDALPASMYKSSTLVDFRHDLTALHTWFSSGSSSCACFDIWLYIWRPSSTHPMFLF